MSADERRPALLRGFVRIAPLLLGAVLVPAVAVAAPTEQTFGTHLTGAEEVPPRDTPAQGEAIFRLDREGIVHYRLIASNIENVFAAHIHCGEFGVNGPVKVTLFTGTPGSGPQNGVLAEGSFDASQFSCGEVPLVEAMRAGDTYVNVHTNDAVGGVNTGPGDFPGGEIRGQIEAHGPPA